MDVSQAFAELNARFADTVNDHDASSWAALFAEDAVLVPADQASVTGRRGIEEWGEMATQVWNHLEIKQEHCSAAGNIAWETGTWTGNINVPDQQTMDVSGRFLLVAQKEGSTWRIKAHTWNVTPRPH